MFPSRTYSTKEFIHETAFKTFWAEASDLGVRAGASALGSIYKDAADLGIFLKSEKTGYDSTWVFRRFLMDNTETEQLGWELEPTEATVRRFPGLDGYIMYIYND